MNTLESAIKWCNNNSGFVSVLLFIVTLTLGWVSGFFKSIIKKPKFKIRIIPGPTLCSTFSTGEMHGEHKVHRTAISVYLNIANIGTSPANIDKIWVGYHWKSYRYSLFWFWLKEQMVTMKDFQYDFGENIKIYPSLMQGTTLTLSTVDTYLEIGKSANGVVYFEQDDSWGTCHPVSKKGHARFRVKIIDTFGGKHHKTFYAPIVNLEEAIKYNPSFGETLTTLRQQNENKN